MDISNTNKNRIRELRKEKDITQVRLSIELDVTQETISAYENGRHLPSLLALMKMSVLFNCSMDYIMGLTDVRLNVDNSNLSPDAKKLLLYYDMLSDFKKGKVMAYIQGLSENE